MGNKLLANEQSMHLPVRPLELSTRDQLFSAAGAAGSSLGAARRLNYVLQVLPVFPHVDSLVTLPGPSIRSHRR